MLAERSSGVSITEAEAAHQREQQLARAHAVFPERTRKTLSKVTEVMLGSVYSDQGTAHVGHVV